MAPLRHHSAAAANSASATAWSSMDSKKPKKPDPVAVGLVVQPIADGRDAADDLAVALGQEVLGLGVLEEGVLGAGEEGCDVPTQRRDPERVPRVESVGQVDEALEVPSVTRRADAQRWGQMTPRSRPMRANCSSAKSIWSNVCVAMRLVRSRHWDGGTAGGATGLVNTPASNSRRHIRNVFSSGPISTGTIGVWVGPMSKPRLPEAVLQPAGVGPEQVAPLRLVLQHLQRGQHAGGVGRGQRGGEDQRPAVVLEVVDHVLRRRDEPADGRQRLGERAGDDVDLVGHAEMGRGAVAVGAEHAEGVRVIERQRGAVLPRHPDEARHVGDVAFHRVHAVHHDHRARGRSRSAPSGARGWPGRRG